jgi:hypothetical protein
MFFRKEPRYFHKRPRRFKKKSKKFLIAFGWIYLAFLTPALGIEAIVEGRTIKFAPPNGYCLLNELTAGEREAIEAMRQMRQPDHDLLWMFVLCDQIAALRDGKEGRLEQFGYVTAVRPNGVYKPGRNVSRFDYASKVAKSLPPIDPAAVARELKKREITPSSSRFNQLYSGVATMDAAAVYLGSVMEEVWGRSRSLTAGVTAITRVKDQPIAVTMHGPFTGISYQILRSELRPLIGDVITRNEPGVEPFQKVSGKAATGQGNWLSRQWQNLAIAGMLSGALAGFALFFARRLRDQRPHTARQQNGQGSMTF